jgi:hypothetical protein
LTGVPERWNFPRMNTLERLLEVADRARAARLPREDVAFVRDALPARLGSLSKFQFPKSVRHPRGFTVTGAPVRTFRKSALLLAAQRALGARFGGHEFYEEVEQFLALHVMRSHFELGYPKGTYCCQQCTLAVYPVLEAKAIRYFDCATLAKSVEQIIRRKQWRFKRPANAAMLRWSLWRRVTWRAIRSARPRRDRVTPRGARATHRTRRQRPPRTASRARRRPA